jgi:hypothetical protein
MHATAPGNCGWLAHLRAGGHRTAFPDSYLDYSSSAFAVGSRADSEGSETGWAVDRLNASPLQDSRCSRPENEGIVAGETRCLDG